MRLYDRPSANALFARTLEAGEEPVSIAGRPTSLTAPATLGSTQSFFRRVRAIVNASAWTSLVGRALAVIVGLVVLAWIGRAATAATPHSTISRVLVTPNAEPATGTLGSTPLSSGASLPSPPPAPAPPTPPPPPAPPPPAITPPTAPSSSPSSPHTRATADDPVYINDARVEELRRLPGVGPKRATAIVELRQRMGKFRRVEDLLRVKGVGRATLRKWRPLVRLDPRAIPDAGVP